MEAHFRYWMVLEICYAPAPHARELRRLNDTLIHCNDDGEAFAKGCFPEDLPIDAAASVLEYPLRPAAEIQELLLAQDSLASAEFYLLTALYHDDLRIQDVLEKLAGSDPIGRRSIGDIAIRYDYDTLLRRLWATETDESLRTTLKGVLASIDAPATRAYRPAARDDDEEDLDEDDEDGDEEE
jgi:hypothetical protein